MGGSNEFVECLGGVWQPRVVLGQLSVIFRSAMSGRFNQSIASQQWWDKPASNQHHRYTKIADTL